MAAYAGVLGILSVIPAGAAGAVPYLDKVVHVGEYLIFAWLLVHAMYANGADRPEYLIWAWIYASSYGCLMELLQVIIPWRSADVLDAVANALGAAVGTFLCFRSAHTREQ